MTSREIPRAARSVVVALTLVLTAAGASAQDEPAREWLGFPVPSKATNLQQTGRQWLDVLTFEVDVPYRDSSVHVLYEDFFLDGWEPCPGDRPWGIHADGLGGHIDGRWTTWVREDGLIRVTVSTSYPVGETGADDRGPQRVRLLRQHFETRFSWQNWVDAFCIAGKPPI